MNGTILHNEKELISQLNAGDRNAFVVVYEQFYPLITLFAKRYVGGEAARDITAEVFTRLWKLRKQFESSKHLRSSLLLTARNLCIDQLRAKNAELKRQAELYYLEAHTDVLDFQTDTVRAQVYQLVLDEINRLPSYLKDVFSLAYLDGLSNAEIAKQLQIKETSVRTKKSQALDILRTKLSRIEFALLITYFFRHFQD